MFQILGWSVGAISGLGQIKLGPALLSPRLNVSLTMCH